MTIFSRTVMTFPAQNTIFREVKPRTPGSTSRAAWSSSGARFSSLVDFHRGLTHQNCKLMLFECISLGHHGGIIGDVSLFFLREKCNNVEHGFVCQGDAHSYAHSNRDNYDKHNTKTIKFDPRLKQTDKRQIGKNHVVWIKSRRLEVLNYTPVD